ncbi:MAG: hypothetical protein NZ958_06885 [Bacteroidia bacterium]|nr:hypothetical protein [Bacteroidia bacterium]MDW8089422.1 hypothetical protein [Bacteroidia bacterium]
MAIFGDVIEHLEDTELALSRIESLLQPGGFLLVVFPPYPSPCGGYQPISRSFWGKVPYLHSFPEKTFSWLLPSEASQENSEVFRLRTIRLSYQNFLRAVRQAGLGLKAEPHSLLWLALRYRLGLPFVPLVFLAPFVRLRAGLLLIFCAEVGYLLQKPFIPNSHRLYS